MPGAPHRNRGKTQKVKNCLREKSLSGGRPAIPDLSGRPFLRKSRRKGKGAEGKGGSVRLHSCLIKFGETRKKKKKEASGEQLLKKESSPLTSKARERRTIRLALSGEWESLRPTERGDKTKGEAEKTKKERKKNKGSFREGGQEEKRLKI